MKIKTHYGEFKVAFGVVTQGENQYNAIKVDESVFYCDHLNEHNITGNLLEKVIDCSEEVDYPETFIENK